MGTISIIGSGGMAASIGRLAAKAGHSVEVTSRDATKARALALQFGAGATAGGFGEAPSGDIVILAIPYSAVLDVLRQYGEKLAGKILVDITNPIKSDLSGFLTSPDTFGAKEIARVAPPARSLSRPSTPRTPTCWRLAQSTPSHWTCSSPGTTRKRRQAFRHSSKASDCARWMRGRLRTVRGQSSSLLHLQRGRRAPRGQDLPMGKRTSDR